MATTVSLVMCNDMHMDIEQANELLGRICQNPAYESCEDYTVADIIIIMTCAFGSGKRYSMYVIADVKRTSKKDAVIFVTGCLATLCQTELEKIPGVCVKTIPEIKAIFGKSAEHKKLVGQNKIIISYGCRKHCTYCVYPQFAGEYTSKPVDQVLKEVEEMYPLESTIYISGGLETSDYGVDLYNKRKFPELMDIICENFPACQYVIGWFHPAGLTDELLEVIAKRKNIAEIMVHIQHVNEPILRNMNRPSFRSTHERIMKLKSSRPDIIISTEVIVGFPGETEKEFQELVEYLDLGLFQDIGVASYEPVPGTKAATLPGLPSFDERQQRMRYISQRYGCCTTYPAPANSDVPLLQMYEEASKFFSNMPLSMKKIEARQQYQFVAGIDTKSKMPENFMAELMKIQTEIVNARDEYGVGRAKKNLDAVYTAEFKSFAYQVMAHTLKPAVLERAKKILL